MQTITLKNTGTASLSISSLGVTGADSSDFGEADNCGSGVSAGGKCTITLTFTPSASGTRQATLSLADNATGSPQSVALAGTGAHDVILTWIPSSTPGISYDVYRGTTSGGESSTPLTCWLASATNCIDAGVASGATYYYFVTAVEVVGSKQIQSAKSNQIEVSIP